MQDLKNGKHLLFAILGMHRPAFLRNYDSKNYAPETEKNQAEIPWKQPVSAKGKGIKKLTPPNKIIKCELWIVFSSLQLPG